MREPRRIKAKVFLLAVAVIAALFMVGGKCSGGAPRPGRPPQVEGFAFIANDGSLRTMDWNGAGEQIVAPDAGEAFAIEEAIWVPGSLTLAYRTSQGTLVSAESEQILDDGSDGLVRSGPTAIGAMSFPTNDLLYVVGYYKATNDPVKPFAPWIATIDGKRMPLPDPDCRFSYGSQYVVCASDTEPGNTQVGWHVYVMKLDGSGRQEISDNADPTLWYWSPDGRWLAYYENPGGGSAVIGDIHVHDLQIGRDIALGKFSSDENPQWFPSSSYTIFDNLEIDPATGNVRELGPRPAAMVASSDYSGLFAYVDGSAWGKGTLTVFDYATGQKTPLYTIDTTLSHPLVPGFQGDWSNGGRYLAFSAVVDGPNNKAVIAVADLETGSVNELFRDVDADSVVLAYAYEDDYLLIGQRAADGRRMISIADADGSNVREVAEGTPITNPWHEIFQVL